ncbi:oligosaccharide flippase family protein [Streptomyces beijiangensis]|uniref:Oligosaccharide flippase family protein n=1 Tax=Streptomyces beijiangensis TaxID=163361 RepID=A0A939F4Z1_9ACTN|nr:oligosaccharide flippase family protein [Streptomyces beijiangensis]MBO0511748.1 oligosaccharide flippase family protein [Streptomyces beijiangensis]
MTTARSAARSLLWNYAGSALTVVLQLGYTACTARLVAPTAFGAYAIATAVLGLLGYFANGGVATCLLRTPELTRPLVGLALRTTTITGACCFLLVQLAAPAAGVLWDIEGLVTLLRLLSTQFLVVPVALAASAALRRMGLAAEVVRYELLGQCTGFGLSVILLGYGWNPYALAVAAPIASSVVLAGSLRLLVARKLPDGPRPPLAELLGPSTFFAGHSLVQYGCNTAPLWLAGALLGPTTVGYYSRASLFTGLPLTMLAQGINRAVAPVLAESHDVRAERDALCVASAIGLIGFGTVAALGPTALPLLLGPDWELAGHLVPLLAAGAAFSLVTSVGDSINQVRHDPAALIRSQCWAAAAIACTLGAATLQHSLTLLTAASVTGPLAAHGAQLVRWGRPFFVTALRDHAAHAAVGGALFAIGPAAERGPYTGLTVALTVLGGLVLLWKRLPLYAVAHRLGLTSTSRSGPGPGRQRVTSR